MHTLNKYQAFTLLEMLVVLVIIALLAGLVGPRLFGHVDESKVKTANIQLKMLKGAIGTFYLDIGRYPTDEEGLAVLRVAPSDDNVKSIWKGPYLEEAVPLDPWITPINIVYPVVMDKLLHCIHSELMVNRVGPNTIVI